MKYINLFLCVWCLFAFTEAFSFNGGNMLPGPHMELQMSAVDTIPLKDREGDFINDSYYNPFDITPSTITQEVEYDPVTGNYIILEKIGDEYYRTPTYMTFSEYMEWRSKQQEQAYFAKLGGMNSGIKSGSGKVDPMSRIDVKKSLVDRLFGGTDVELKPQGSIDLTFGGDYQRRKDPTIPIRQQRTGGFDFDMGIQINVDGSIGEKLKLGFNYDTEATFDFDRKIKIAYDTETFSEDDIIKNIEAGNVSLPLRSQLIQGSQSLFGLKTELQFGHLRITGLASQQRSKQEELVIEGGATVQEFEVRPDEYDENRHFFISHYHRETFENSMSELPYLNSQFRVNRIQVWVTIDPNNVNTNLNTKIICAMSDLAESNPDKYTSDPANFPPSTIIPPYLRDVEENTLPENDVNTLYETLANDDVTRNKSNTSTRLKLPPYSMEQTRDFEILQGRLLSENEYTFHPQLGFLSLNVRLRPNQVLAVAYEYNYTFRGDEVYKVGELTEDSGTSSIGTEVNGQDTMEVVRPANVIYTKMLKSSNQSVDQPTWDLMMKNVYPLGTAQVGQEDFQFDIFFEDNTDGSLKRFIPEPALTELPLLNVFNLDRLNSVLDPQPDGIFDFVPGLTIIPRSGSIIFPVLEPFGSSLTELVGNENYSFQELYDQSVFASREYLEKNRFVMKGRYKSSVSSEISLGAFNIPEGSVTVRAGGDVLTEGVDYEIDYGIGRIRIINDAYLVSGTPIRVSFEDNSVFSLQQKTMLGLRADYEVSKNLNIGATYLRLSERPFTQKVNVGDDPIFNRIFGLDLNYSNEAPWVTKMVDKLPFYSTKEKSNISFSGEVAVIKPGHSGQINANGEDEGVVNIDDFEGAGSAIPIGIQENTWKLASTPITRPEASDPNINLAYGANRARLNWYRIERNFIGTEDAKDSYTRRVTQNELFDRNLALDQIPDLQTFDLSYYPSERGPYNFDPPNGTVYSAGAEWDPDNQRIALNEPDTRWAGIMKSLNNNDFQATNIEYIEFWMLNPFIEHREGPAHGISESGKLSFHLGNVSEDILRDNLQFFENTIPTDPQSLVPISNTIWGEVPNDIPINNGFEQDNESRAIQDVGFDGLDNTKENLKFTDYITDMTTDGNVPVSVITADPSGDDFVYFGDENVYEGETNLLKRYRRQNGPEGNAPARDDNQILRANYIPDSEDMNGNRSLDQGEGYYEYSIDIVNNGFGELDMNASPYITQRDTVSNPETGDVEAWYRFQIPISNPTDTIGQIDGLRSIQFIRMIVEKFETRKTFRFAELEFVRNQWRRSRPLCSDIIDTDVIELAIGDVGVQENSAKEPFNYMLPEGIVQERSFSTYSPVLQDEKSLQMNFCNLPNECEVSIFKLTDLDMRVYKRLQMFVHAEDAIDAVNKMNDEDLSMFIKIGKDFQFNYYEYEIPLELSKLDSAQNEPNIWRDNNMFDIDLRDFTELKKERNLNGSTATKYSKVVDRTGDHERDAEISIIGNPSLGYVKGIQIGVRNNNGVEVNPKPLCGEVWINELRVLGLDERGGWAGLANLEVQMADLGDLTASAGYSSVGFGSLDQKLDQRQKEDIINYDVATNLELGKFFPDNWGLRIPFYAQYSANIIKPQFDPYELDLTVDEVAEASTNPDEIRERADDVTTIKTFNFTNVKKENVSNNKRGGGGNSKSSKPKPWSISNFSASYAFTETNHRDPILSKDRTRDQKLGLDYNYSRKANYIKPFSKLVKSKYLKFIKEINFNLLPNSFSFSNQLRRLQNEREFRLPVQPVLNFRDQRFNWERRYNLQWDLTKALKLSFEANNMSIIDEIRKTGFGSLTEYKDERGIVQPELLTLSDQERDQRITDYWRNNLYRYGRNKDYNHSLSVTYNVPLKNFPLMDWVTMKAQYNADYAWSAAALSVENLGNVIQNGQGRSLNSTFNFDKLYNKWGYLKSIDTGKKSRKRKRSRSGKKDSSSLSSTDKEKDKERKKKNESKGPSLAERILIRPLMMLRKVKLTYREDLYTVIPGFTGTPENFGMSDGFSSPGWDFVGGIQPNIDRNNSNNWLFQSAGKGWITDDPLLNQQVAQSSNQSYEARLDIEPFRDFSIDVEFKKTYRNDHTEDFKNITNPNTGVQEFQQLAAMDIGSYEVSYFTANTLFGTDIDDLFQTFDQNRRNTSLRLQEVNESPAGIVDSTQFAVGYGRLNSEVIVPSFIAAYSGKTINEVSLDLNADISNRSYIPRPNWTLTYRGLNKLPVFKEIFSSFNVSHSYKNTLRVNSYFSDQEYDAENPYSETKINGNYYSRIEIPEIQINEQFAPIIGISLKTKNDMEIDFEWRKSRNLNLSLATNILQESLNEEFTFNFGYLMKGVNISFLTRDNGKNRKRKSRKDQEEEADEDDNSGRNNRRSSRGVNSSRGRDLTISFGMSFNDEVSYIHRLERGTSAQPERGLKTFRLSPAIDYSVNEDLTLRLFFDYSNQKPYITTAYPITTYQGGLTVSFNLN